VVDAEDLFLGEVAAEQLRQLPRGREVVAERLLDDQPCPAVWVPEAGDLRDDVRHDLRRNCEVVDAVAASASLLVDLQQQLCELIPS
jgi:hypothetical protein